MRTLYFGSIMMLVTGCSSPGVKGYQPNETLETVNDSSKPSWADETTPFKISSGKVYSLGVCTLRGDERPEAGARIAESNAKANFARAIENRMEFIFQNSEENASFNSVQTKYIASEVSNLVSHSMVPEGMWWKRYAMSEEDGTRRIYYKVYSLITMPEGELKKSIDSAINKKVPEKTLSESFQKQVDKQWDRFVEGKIDQPKTESLKPEPKNVSSEIVKQSDAKPAIEAEPDVVQAVQPDNVQIIQPDKPLVKEMGKPSKKLENTQESRTVSQAVSDKQPE